MPKKHQINNLSDLTLNPIARHAARRYALQAMYQWQLSGTPVKDIEAEFLNYHINKEIDLVYFKELIREVPNNQQEIDRVMQPYLTRSLKEIDPIELAVLRLAIYELINRADVPYRVIINEALELTKKFGSIEGFKFVNGILDKVARVLRSKELQMKRDAPLAKTLKDEKIKDPPKSDE